MKLAGSFEAAVEVAEQNCREWIFLGSGEVYHADELHEIAKEFDEKTPLEEEDFLAVTDDGSSVCCFRIARNRSGILCRRSLRW